MLPKCRHPYMLPRAMVLNNAVINIDRVGMLQGVASMLHRATVLVQSSI